MKADRNRHKSRSVLSLLMKTRRELVSWAAILLLAVNVLASGALPAQPISLSQNDVVALLDSEICSDHGSGQPSSDLPDTHDGHGLHCVFCLPLLHGGLALPDAVAAIERPVQTKAGFAVAVDQQLVIPARFRSFAAPRAPPLA